MVYNTTNLTNANNFYDQLIAVNSLADGYIGLFLLASVFFILFIVFKKYEQDTKETLLFCSIITSLIGVLMWAIQLISWKILIYPIIMIFVSVIVYMFTD